MPFKGYSDSPCFAKTSCQLISLEFQVSGLHAASMKILLLITVVQALKMLVFAWFNRTAGFSRRNGRISESM